MARELLGSYLFEFTSYFVVGHCVAWIIAFALLRTVVSTMSAGILASIKVGTVFIYFLLFADSTFQVGGDSTAYLQGAFDFLERGYPWEIHESKSLAAHLIYIFQNETGRFIPYLFFYLCMTLFGPDYYAPILGNVLVTILSGILLMKAVGGLSQSTSYQKKFFVFFLLHWFTIAWSSIIILKEPLVVLLFSMCLFGLKKIEQHNWRGIIWIVIGLLALRYTRYYYPVVLILGTLPAYLANKNKVSWLILVIPFALAIYWLSDELVYFWKLVDWRGVVQNAVHFVLQPVPWRITEPAGFLKIPAILHWIMLIPAMVGSVILWQRSRFGKILVFIFLANVAFFALVPAIGSTRHRAPADALLVVMQFEFLWVYVIGRNGVTGKGRIEGKPC